MAEEGTRPKSNLAATQRYAAGALLAIALHQAQIHQTQPLGSPDEDEPPSHDRISSGSSSTDSISEDPELWVHENSALLRPIFRFLEIDSAAWPGLEETAGSSPAKHHVGAFMRLLAEEGGDQSSEKVDQEIALSKAVDAMVQEMETNAESSKSKKEKHQEYEHECREKLTSAESESDSKSGTALTEPLLEQQKEHEALRRLSVGEGLVATREGGPQAIDTPTENEVLGKLSLKDIPKMSEASETQIQAMAKIDASTIILRPNDDFQEHDRSLIQTPAEEVAMLSYQKKVTVLFELLSACLAVANTRQDNKKYTRKRKGYDARHRAALRLLATWFDIKWIEMEAIESIVACSAMAVKKQEELKNEEASSSESKWVKWKRGGIIGAAALTGGTLMAITGGLAAPAIAAGFSALAPTLGTLIPVIGASGFAAAATAAGSVAGSVAVAASFGAAGAGLTGSKMARRTGSVDEFEFKAIGDSHKQGRLAVEIMVSGFVFDEQDFRKPWEGKNDNMERYVLQWESKNLIAVSTAIQDWLTSRIALELMRQGAMMTVLSSLLVALAWPATLLAAADLIDSRWTIAVDRSDKAGKLLAEVLVKGLQGNRPVTLIGYSLGARVVFKCLQALAETEQNAELVERVVLLGAPISIKGENWEAARKMVAGRFVNAYSANDWMLGVAFRASLLTQGLAGIQPINVPGIENVDVTDFIEGHSSYLWATQPILEQLELEAYYPVFKKKDSEKGK